MTSDWTDIFECCDACGDALALRQRDGKFDLRIRDQDGINGLSRDEVVDVAARLLTAAGVREWSINREAT